MARNRTATLGIELVHQISMLGSSLSEITMRNSKSILPAAVALSAIFSISAASAADMAVKAPPMAAPIPTWTGFYLGGDVGWDGSWQNGTSNPQPAGFGVPPVIGGGLAGGGFTTTSSRFNPSSLGGGLYGGYNWQSGTWLVGVEGDITFLSLKRSNTQAFQGTCCAPLVPAPTMTMSTSETWLASARGRLGAVAGSWLFYGTGGAAWTQVSYAANLTPDGLAFPLGTTANANFNRTTTGFVVGAGIEHMFSNNWIGRIEYLYYGFPGASGIAPVVSTATCPGCSFGINFGNLQVQTVRAGLSYKFGGPVVARY
jgi:outer membrane immunogenic protein